MTDADREVADTIRTEGARILATLVRVVGDLHLAEDAVQEAAIRALAQWPISGVPDSPRAWLTVTARRVAVDVIRREGLRGVKERGAMDLQWDDEPPDHVVRDDLLRLIFTCGHPALSLDARVTLALRVLCGFSTAQIASVLLVGEPAIAKRLTRTRAKIARAGIPYHVPSAGELPQRLSAVCAVLHAMYTHAHTATEGQQVTDTDGCAEAVRLSQLLHELMPDEATPMAVLALLLLTEARRSARTDADGIPVALAEQDRSQWDAAAIEEGLGLLDMSLRRTDGLADPYQLQAAIAAQHAIATSYNATDWTEIVRLYDLLLEVLPSPPAALARAVAVAESRGVTAGLAALDGLDRDHRWHAVRGELLARDGRYADAADEVRRSLEGAVSEAEAHYRRRRIDEWDRSAH
ncbi:RNA polymerase sigma factor [Mycolicibacterium iranicum]|uniref:Uncharacterized protein n=1 Tax=Mycolicibacterium iranicum TaxID=912594 RepID=A0A178LY20_MYCIR|nr:DUF6596 domain-containing protein [Mycolicibacterium iranicum]OAN38988.1 hypothetical protein A4X20_19630 [Mycolicibacterium iranicum]